MHTGLWKNGIFKYAVHSERGASIVAPLRAVQAWEWHPHGAAIESARAMYYAELQNSEWKKFALGPKGI